MTLTARLALAAALVAAACAPRAAAVQDTGAAAPAGAASNVVRRAVVRAAELSSQATVELQARYNPASCDCPPFEVYWFGSWIRSGLEPERNAPEAVTGLMAAPPPEGRAIRLVVDTRPAGTVVSSSWVYPVWTVLAVVAPTEAR